MFFLDPHKGFTDSGARWSAGAAEQYLVPKSYNKSGGAKRLGKGTAMKKTYIKEYVPASWFHPKGIHKVLKRFWHRLPDVSGCLFATFTIDRQAMRAKGYGPSESFDCARDRVRRVFHKLRKGVQWDGKTYQICCPFCTKVEFHDDEEGWAHFHVIWLTRRFVPAELLESLWSHGFADVRRIKNEDFHYLLKYVCKSGKIPEWVQDRKRIRIFQPSRGFLKPEDEKPESESSDEEKKSRKSYTIRERLQKWERLALHIVEDLKTGKKKFCEMPLRDTFRNLFDRLVYAVALDGRYLGNGIIQIKNNQQLDPWINLYQNHPQHS